MIAHEEQALFWGNVDRSGGPDACWAWRGPVDRQGLPTFDGDRAERVAWKLARPLAAPLDDRQLEPRCKTGAGCVNPAHWMLEARAEAPAAAAWAAAARPARAEASQPATVVNAGLERCPHCQRGAYTRKQITAILRVNFCDLCKPERRELMPALGARRKPAAAATVAEPAPLARVVEASAAPARGQGVDGILLTGQLLGVVSSYLASNPAGLDVVRGALEDVARTVGRA